MDSLLIDGVVYYHVIPQQKIRKVIGRPDYLPVDSAYFNYDFGLLAIFFPNENHYFLEN